MKKKDEYRTLDILEVISEEFILTFEILKLRFPEIDFNSRVDTHIFKNAIAVNKSSILNSMLSDKRKFDKEIYDILINDEIIDTGAAIKIEIIKNNQDENKND